MSKLLGLWKKVRCLGSSSYPLKLDNLLRHDLQQLWQSRNKLDLEVRHEFGRLLNLRLNTADQKRQRDGAAIMKRMSEELGVSRTELHRMCKFARVFKNVAAFKAACPTATTWEKVKEVLSKYGEADAAPSKIASKDPTLAFWQQKARSLNNVLSNFDEAPAGTWSEDAQTCLQEAEAAVEKLSDRLSTCSTNPVPLPSTPEGNDQQEGTSLSSAQ